MARSSSTTRIRGGRLSPARARVSCSVLDISAIFHRIRRRSSSCQLLRSTGVRYRQEAEFAQSRYFKSDERATLHSPLGPNPSTVSLHEAFTNVKAKSDSIRVSSVPGALEFLEDPHQ